jgi:hypothetical protein
MAVESTTSDLKDLDLSEEEVEQVRAAMVANEDRLKQAFASLAGSIEARFFQRASRRKIKETEWRKALELYLGNLSLSSFVDSDRPFSEIKDHSNRPYYNLVANKCEIAIAQSVDMQFAGGEKNWALTTSVNSADPAENEKKRKMEDVIEAQLESCHWGKKCRRAIEDRVILGTGVVKGPVNTGKMYTTYQPLEGSDMWVPKPSVDKSPSIEWVNPWFFFPDDTVNSFDQAQDTIQVHPCSPLDLRKWKDHPGFLPSAIDEALKTMPEEYLLGTYTDYAHITDSNPYLFKEKYMVLEYHGPIEADELDNLSVERPSYDPINNAYYGEVWVAGGKVIRIELENIEASFEVPYAVSTWKKDPSSIFGFGSPLLMKDSQRVARETWRMMLDNASLSSGPQIAMHRQFVEPANGSWQLNPNKAWNLLDSSVDVEKAIQFFNIPNTVADLIPILDMARSMAEEESMTPMIAGGLQGADSQESATGQLIMREASTTVLDFLSEDWDDNVTEKVIRRMYGWNMQYNPDPSIKGNFTVDVRTAAEFKNKQIYVRDLERLSVEVAQNPQMAIYINQGELYRARLQAMTFPYSSIVNSEEQIAAAQEAAANQPNPDEMKAQVDMERIKVENRKIDLAEAQLQFELKQQQQREIWEHEERMSANRARELEAMAMVTRTQNEKEIQYLQIAQKSESETTRNQIMAQIAILNDQTKKTMALAEQQAKARDQILTAAEMKLARQTGEGI